MARKRRRHFGNPFSSQSGPFSSQSGKSNEAVAASEGSSPVTAATGGQLGMVLPESDGAKPRMNDARATIQLDETVDTFGDPQGDSGVGSVETSFLHSERVQDEALRNSGDSDPEYSSSDSTMSDPTMSYKTMSESYKTMSDRTMSESGFVTEGQAKNSDNFWSFVDSASSGNERKSEQESPAYGQGRNGQSRNHDDSANASSRRARFAEQPTEDGRDYSVEPIGARIKVIGIGGGGTNAVNNMIRSGLKGVEFIAANTDIQSLRSSLADTKLQLGTECTKGLGAGANPEMGEQAARESEAEIREILKGADMVFVTAGMGGGTGGGGASVVAQIGREVGALTVGVVTKPFLFEGKRRMGNADSGMANLKREVDTLITIPNQRLLSIAGRNTTLLDCFRRADDVLFQAVKGISDLILFEGLVNVDFADVKAVMSEMGMAMMGSGEGEGENRAMEAAEKAISSPLLEDISIHGARGILINVTAGPDVTLQEINEAAELIHSEAHDEANIIWGMVIDPEMKDKVRVTVIATGFGEENSRLLSMPMGTSPVAPQVDATGYDKKLDIPTFSRNKLKEAPVMIPPVETVKLKKMSVTSPAEEEDKYEIPTFLRRQVD